MIFIIWVLEFVIFFYFFVSEMVRVEGNVNVGGRANDMFLVI